MKNVHTQWLEVFGKTGRTFQRFLEHLMAGIRNAKFNGELKKNSGLHLICSGFLGGDFQVSLKLVGVAGQCRTSHCGLFS